MPPEHGEVGPDALPRAVHAEAAAHARDVSAQQVSLSTYVQRGMVVLPAWLHTLHPFDAGGS